jgi:hypothetical protein
MPEGESNMLKHWRAVLGALALLQPVWTFIKWTWDWLGRLDLVASHLHDFGVQAVLDFIENPPPAALVPSIIIGLLLIWWDLKRKGIAVTPEEAALPPDPYQKLRLGFYIVCAAIGVSVWVVAWPTIFPSMTFSRPPAPPAQTSKLISNLSRVILVCDSPKPEKPPSLEERKAELAERLDVLEKIFGQTVTGDVTDNETTLSSTISTPYGVMNKIWLAKRSGDKV